MNYYTSACLFKIENINVMTTEDDDLGDSSSDSMSSASEESDSSPEESVQAAAPTLKSSSSDRPAGEPSNDKSSLLQQLPTKRGLSKHYQGKSQSFKSLSNVRVLEDLQKPEHPYNKKLKTKLKSVQYPRDNACLSLNPLSGDNQVQVQNQNPPTQNKTTICSSRPQIPKDKQTSSQDTSSSSISEANNNSTKMIEQKP